MALPQAMTERRRPFPMPDIREIRQAGDRTRLALLAIALLVVGSVFSMLFSVTTGASDASILDVISNMAGSETALSTRDRIIIFDIRLPRAILGFLIGASLAVSGTVMQGLFRNPLADPGLVGVSSGASLGAVAMIVLGSGIAAPLQALLGIYALPAAAFGGGLVTTLLLYRIATRHGQTSVATMLLAGIALGALALAITGLLIYMANDQQLRDLTFWSMGSLAGATWTKIAAASPIVLLSFTALPFMARGLNAITLGEAAAFHMGVPVQRLKNVAIVGVAAATGASVAVSGGIGFVGIVVPHILRMAIGPDHRFLLPAAALLGGSLLIFADVLARTLVAPAELPIGIITAAVGGPFFLWILLRQRSRLAL
ncbi:iron ABC transporter permease [Rhizobium ruizarguesonis]|uniref:FecCD family ABC transporter permease n=1 Tax=Rhizobium ruizarguesonis TaxID=2081791 RepID=UPI00102FF8E3|nr:iron ABC transporter permease [Rhizobium ruizarguesonis]QIJ41793.1 iron ABC transporter permease [Rhizobium leguminosarum]NEH31232.1 iron chelate uptake ABC transporter family permease subunit [Rhizobium ruizarguesonis]NEJ07905.1 iron chelate uptake ABC transporter family permease subunit [Rhizobium ruizarguesonis]NEK11796.1 iron chelate uptake ABC transporter family permease subunit [Rhizobium ruizarguesonis]TAU11294.1 iron ABC transporter permease [Rhizobium ruizarguesonis]